MTYADLKPSLIDLEAGDTATGRKLELDKQRERLSERGNMYCVYWIRRNSHTDVTLEGYVGISKNFKERMRAHRKNKKKSPLVSAKEAIGWNNLVTEVLYTGLSLEEALEIELQLRPEEYIGWNAQKGGNIGVDSSWYSSSSNRNKHSEVTSSKTKLGIALKDSPEARSKRAKINWENNRESYKDKSVGSNNPRALLNEGQVREIKYILIPSGLKDKEISDKFGVKPHVISFIRSGKNWKHI